MGCSAMRPLQENIIKTLSMHIDSILKGIVAGQKTEVTVRTGSPKLNNRRLEKHCLV